MIQLSDPLVAELKVGSPSDLARVCWTGPGTVMVPVMVHVVVDVAVQVVA